MKQPTPLVTYRGQLFDQKANFGVLGFLLVFLFIGLCLPRGEGRWMVVVLGAGLSLLAFFVLPLILPEKRQARKASALEWAAYEVYLQGGDTPPLVSSSTPPPAA